MTESRRERIVILGGGVGAVAAAFALTEGPNAGRYDITMYQIGWRLGGKGASSRRGPARRIEEHGMHIWFGFYDNALAMMERCYQALGDDRDTFANAFVDQDFVVLEDYYDERWTHFPIRFPRGDHDREPGPKDFARALWRWISQNWTAAPKLMRAGSNIVSHTASLLEAMTDEPSPKTIERYASAVDAVRRKVDRGVEVMDLPADQSRWTRMMLHIALSVLRGMAVDRILWRGFDVIDHWDLWPWLSKHGAPADLERCVMIRGLYTQAFAFPGGNEVNRSMAAGASLRAALRMLFGYRGAFMRRMRAGMGDIVFAPFYRVLKQRGVQFKFFHRVRGLHVADGDPDAIGTITLGRQVSLRPRATAPHRTPSCCPEEPDYDPLITVPDTFLGAVRHCWRDEPDEQQIREDDVAKIHAMKTREDQYFNLESAWTSWDAGYEKDCVLERGKHFDHVVLAISAGALGKICSELVQHSSKWSAMVQTTKTVRTQAAQLWLYPNLEQLGWTMAEPINGAYAFPMDSWASMNQTRPPEQWPAEHSPAEIAYFCGVLPHGEADPEWFTDPGFPARQRAAVVAWLKGHLKHNIGHLWPKAIADGDFDWNMLVDLTDATGDRRLDSQFLIANVDPTERYVLSVPESMAHRLPSDDSDFSNLTLAGDWTKNPVNLGCVEAAVSSGMIASRGISGYPASVAGESDR